VGYLGSTSPRSLFPESGVAGSREVEMEFYRPMHLTYHFSTPWPGLYEEGFGEYSFDCQGGKHRSRMSG